MIIDKERVIEEHGITFPDDFSADIESWFSANIACCSGCYDEFTIFWPLANNIDFECSSIDMQSFYSGSKRCQQNYSEEEFEILISLELCPRCDESLSGRMIWLYELPFKYDINVYQFESNIYDLVRLSETTPFLLLTNKYALEILETLKNLSLATTPKKIESSLYRARVASQITELNFSEFGLAPVKVIQEGRYNHSGQQALYLASDQQTCFFEVGGVLSYIAECKINKEIKILDLCNPEDSHPSFGQELSALVYSALLSRSLDTEGYHKPCYVFSRFITDCAKLANFDAIKYPSTKMLHDNFNLVLLNNTVANNNVEFNCLTLKDKNQSYPLCLDT